MIVMFCYEVMHSPTQWEPEYGIMEGFGLWPQLMYVKMLLNGALHYSTRSKRGLDVASAHALCLTTSYFVQVFQVCSGDSKDFWKCQKWSGSSEVIWNWSIVQREGSVEVK